MKRVYVMGVHRPTRMLITAYHGDGEQPEWVQLVMNKSDFIVDREEVHAEIAYDWYDVTRHFSWMQTVIYNPELWSDVKKAMRDEGDKDVVLYEQDYPDYFF